METPGFHAEVKPPVKIVEKRLESGIKTTEVAGGQWDPNTLMYSLQRPDGIKTVYSFIPEFGVNRYSVKTESYRDGKRVYRKNESDPWRRQTLADTIRIEFARWRTIGHLSSGGKQMDVHEPGKPDTKLTLVEYKNMWQRDSRTQLNSMYTAPQTR